MNLHSHGVQQKLTFQSYAARKGLEASCHSGYFFAVVALQWSDALISKTRKNSIVMQGIE